MRRSRIAPACCRASLGGIKYHRGTQFILFLCRVGIQLVDLAARQGCGVERAIRSQAQSLNAQVLGFKEGEWLFALPSGKPQHRSRRTGSGKDLACVIGNQCPHKSRRRGQLLGQPGSLAQLPVALNRHSVRSAFLKLLHLRLRPQVRSLGGGKRGARRQSRGNKKQKRERGERGERATRGSGLASHSSVESTRDWSAGPMPNGSPNAFRPSAPLE